MRGNHRPLPPVDSPFDPRSHLLFAVALLIHLFRWREPAAVALLFGLWLAYVALHRLPLLPFLRILRFLRWLLLVTMALHLLMTPGFVLWRIPGTELWITREGVAMALLTALRLTLALWFAHALYRCVVPEKLVAGLVRLAGPFARPGGRLDRLAMVASLAMGFLPWFGVRFQEWRRQPRVAFDTRLRRLIADGEEEIAARVAMARRGELPDPRSQAATLRLAPADLLLTALTIAALAVGWTVELQ